MSPAQSKAEKYTRRPEHRWHGEVVSPFNEYRGKAFWEINSGYLRWIKNHGSKKIDLGYLKEPAYEELQYRAANEGHFYKGEEPILPL